MAHNYVITIEDGGQIDDHNYLEGKTCRKRGAAGGTVQPSKRILMNHNYDHNNRERWQAMIIYTTYIIITVRLRHNNRPTGTNGS
jgi:hypothetical protein